MWKTQKGNSCMWWGISPQKVVMQTLVKIKIVVFYGSDLMYNVTWGHPKHFPPVEKTYCSPIGRPTCWQTFCTLVPPRAAGALFIFFTKSTTAAGDL